jgi:glycosyltransferase involved in cell wall biosynthesis
MNTETACLVDYELITIKEDAGPYKAGNRWADPDVHQAAEYMKKLCSDENTRRRLADNAKAHIRETLSGERAAMLIRRRIEEIYKEAAKV